jgi:hypothetical protein
MFRMTEFPPAVVAALGSPDCVFIHPFSVHVFAETAKLKTTEFKEVLELLSGKH